MLFNNQSTFIKKNGQIDSTLAQHANQASDEMSLINKDLRLRQHISWG